MYDRRVIPGEFPSGDELTQSMAAIGMRFSVESSKTQPNIEDVLLAASWSGIVDGELRVLAVLTTWLGVHHEIVNVDRLTRAGRAMPMDNLRAYWVSVAQWLRSSRKDMRWKRLAESWPSNARNDLVESPEFHLSRFGEDKRFSGSPLRVPANVLRDRADDVDTQTMVAARHGAYRARVMMGARYSSDMWPILEAEPTLSAAELARRSYGSYATAADIKRRRALLHEVAAG